MPVLKKDVKVGGYYAVRIGDAVVACHIRSECRFGGWNATNLDTRKSVRIRTAARLRWPLTEQESRAFGRQLPQIAEIRQKMLQKGLRPDDGQTIVLVGDDEF